MCNKHQKTTLKKGPKMETLSRIQSQAKIRNILFSWFIALVAVMAFVRCESPVAPSDNGSGVVRASEPVGACHTGTGVAGDSVLGIASYPLKISATENLRNRCFQSAEYPGTVDCYSKGRDTLFTVETFCE